MPFNSESNDFNNHKSNMSSVSSISDVSDVSKKIKEITEKFDVAESLTDDKTIGILKTEVKDIIKNKNKYDPSDVMTLEIMSEDFEFARQSLKESIVYSKKVIEKATQELLLSEDNKKAGSTMAYAELTNSLLNGIKSYSDLYKNFSATLLNIKKINDEGPQTINNTVNIEAQHNISTVDLINKLKGIDK